MSLNVGGILVLTNDQDRVVRVTKNFWAREGAKPAPAGEDVLAYDSLGLEDTGKLGYAVCPPAEDAEGRTWVHVCDSEQYTASEQLARELASKLDTEVVHYGLYGASDQASLKVFTGPSVVDVQFTETEEWDEVEEAIQPLPHAALYYEEVRDMDEDERAGFVIFGFVGIGERDDDYSGPSAEQLANNAIVADFSGALSSGDHAKAQAIYDANTELQDELIEALAEVAPSAQEAVDGGADAMRIMRAVIAMTKSIRLAGSLEALERLAVAAYCTRSVEIFEQASEALGAGIRGLEVMAVHDIGKKRFTPAVALLRQIVTTTDKSLTAFNNLAHALLYVKPIPDDAADLLDRCDAIGPRNPYVFHNSACAWVRIGDHTKALEAVRNAARHGYEKLESMRTDTDLAPLFDDPEFAKAFDITMDLSEWQKVGRAKSAAVCKAFEDIIDNDAESDEDFAEDERPESLANAVLKRVVALNKAGEWRKARTELDPAHQPFIPHMNETGLNAVVILGPDRFLVRRDEEVLLLDGDDVEVLEGVGAFAISRDRRWLVLAKNEGLVITRDLAGPPSKTIPWPDEVDDVDPTTLETLDIANDGSSIVFASDVVGIWLVQKTDWTKLAPRDGVGISDDDDEDDEDDEEDSDDGLGIDRTHVAISPDGQLVAYGWQDAFRGHYVDRVTGGRIESLGHIAARSDYPYRTKFTDDSKQVLSNSRHMENGSTVCVKIADLGKEDDDEEEVQATDDYLRAYAIALLPGAMFGKSEPVAWIGGAGWSHGVTLSGGKPVFTHLLGSALYAFDFDPVSKRVAVASASGTLHVLDPSKEAELGRERGYHPRHELYRWVFWDGLDEPIRW